MILKKIGWLWNATYNFIEEEKSHLNADNIIIVKSEDLFSNPQTYNKICAFLEHDPLSERKITSIIKSQLISKNKALIQNGTSGQRKI